MNLYSQKELTQFLEENGFFFKKNLGQNFLINEPTAKRIASAPLNTVNEGKKKIVIEIGPGAGNLTRQLSVLFDKVIAIEIDKFAIKLLDQTLCDLDNIEIINTDALKFDYLSLKSQYPDFDFYVCANLPYYITSEMIMTLLECGLPFVSLTFLIQKEAAERFSAKPKTPEYGSICVSAALLANSKKLFNVGPNNFIPKPKVDSSVIQFIPKKSDDIKVKDKKMFSKVVKGAFSARRKTLLNALSSTFKDDFSKEQINEIIISAKITPETRGEALGLSEFIKLSDIFTERQTNK